MAKKDELNFETDNKMASSEKLKALQAAMEKIEKSFGKGSIMKMGDDSVEQVEVIPTGSIPVLGGKVNSIVGFFIVLYPILVEEPIAYIEGVIPCHLFILKADEPAKHGGKR